MAVKAKAKKTAPKKSGVAAKGRKTAPKSKTREKARSGSEPRFVLRDIGGLSRPSVGEELRRPRAARSEDAPALFAKGRGRNVLGRGLSALLMPAAVPVYYQEPAVEEDTPVSMPQVVERPVYPRLVEEASPLPPEEQAEQPERAEDLETKRQEQAAEGLLMLSLAAIAPGKSQPRTAFPAEEIESLARSIRESGLLQPILVRPKSDSHDPAVAYELVAGERRWRAAKAAGLEEIPAIVKELGDRQALEIGIVENVQRADLNPIEEAQAYQRLASEFGATQDDIAKTVAKDRASVANALRLLKLPRSVQDMLVKGAITAGHARALLSLEFELEQESLARKIIRERLSVRAVEELVSMRLGRKKSRSSRREKGDGRAFERTPAVAALEDQLRRALGTKVSLQMTKAGRGEIRINFFSRAELENILERLEVVS